MTTTAKDKRDSEKQKETFIVITTIILQWLIPKTEIITAIKASNVTTTRCALTPPDSSAPRLSLCHESPPCAAMRPQAGGSKYWSP